MISVLIVDDIMILRQGLKAILSQDEEINVVGLAANGLDAFEQCRILKPDVVLMDMRMPEYDGPFGTRKIKEIYPGIKVLILTTFDDTKTVDAAITSGADGYILKEMDDEKIIQAVKTVFSGISVFGQSIFNSMKNRMGTDTKTTSIPNLTDRERDIIRCVVMGQDNKEIASSLYLAEGTVRNNISRLLEKLELKDRTQLAVFAVKNNLD